MERANVQVKLQNGRTINVAWDASAKPSSIMQQFIDPLLGTKSLAGTMDFINKAKHATPYQERVNAKYLYEVNMVRKSVNAWETRNIPWNAKWTVNRTKSKSITHLLKHELKEA